MTGQIEMTTFHGSFSFASDSSNAEEKIRKTPEGRLLWAVLENGVEQYKKNVTSTGRRGRRLFHEAEEWIMHDDQTWLCSFVNICHVLGFDPDHLRAGLQRWREVQLNDIPSNSSGQSTCVRREPSQSIPVPLVNLYSWECSPNSVQQPSPQGDARQASVAWTRVSGDESDDEERCAMKKEKAVGEAH